MLAAPDSHCHRCEPRRQRAVLSSPLDPDLCCVVGNRGKGYVRIFSPVAADGPVLSYFPSSEDASVRGGFRLSMC